jgi:hypothetical protein
MSRIIITTLPQESRHQTPGTKLKQIHALSWLTCASIIISSVIFIVTMFNLGGLSYFSAPIAAFLTIVYHVGHRTPSCHPHRHGAQR